MKHGAGVGATDGKGKQVNVGRWGDSWEEPSL